MREHMGIFRGKRIDNGEWVYGSLLKVTINGQTYWLIFGDDFVQIGADVKAMQHACVDPDTVGECTGLTDKNGKLIFEGDIICFEHNGKTHIDVVEFEPPMFSPSNSCRWSMWRDEVIGNIHDNPELLKGGEG